MTMPPPPPPPPMSQSQLEQGGRPGIPAPPNGNVSGVVVCMNVLSTITHLLLGSVAFGAFICINSGSNLPELKAHVYLTIIGYVLLMSQAILSFNHYTGWANNLKYPQKRTAHWILQVLGSGLAIAGGAMGIATVDRLSWLVHLQSTHSIVGFVAMILTAVSFVGGIVHLLCSAKMSSIMFKTIHACFGSMTLIIAYVAICLGFDMGRERIGHTTINMAIAVTVLALLGMLILTFASMAARGCKSK